MYTKSTKYKYRGHKFDGSSAPLYQYDDNQRISKDMLIGAPNSLGVYNQQNSMVLPSNYQNVFTQNTTSLSENKNDITAPPTTNNESKGNNTFMQGLDSVGQLYAPYATITNTSSQIGNAAAKRAAQGKGLWADKYAELATPTEGVTTEAAAQNAASTISSKVGGYVAPALVALEAGRQIWQGADKDLSGSAFDKESANRAVWNYDSKNPLLNDPLNMAASLTANNYKDYINTLDKVNFNSNTESMRSLGDEWANNQMINLKKSDLKRGVGRSILDNVAATGKGAMMGAAASGGNWVGALAGGIIGTGADVYNKIRGKANQKKILAAANDADERMYKQALNRRDIIADLNKYRDMVNYAALGGKLYADGGNMLNQFEAGGSHEENPYGGILQGIAPDGQPNLVEQGETKWNDENYIFSKRLKVNKQLVKEFNLPKEFTGETFADAISKWGEKFKEMENDALAISTQNAIYTRASEAQEAFRANEQMKELNRQMAKLTPEEQQNLLAQMSQQPMETQQMQYPTSSETTQGEIPQSYALGGHLFSGSIRQKIYDALGIKGGQSAFTQWAKDNNITLDEGWGNWNSYNDWEQFLTANAGAIAKTNPSLGYLLSKNLNPFAEGFDNTVQTGTAIANDNIESNWDNSTTADFLKSNDATIVELRKAGKKDDEITLNDIKNTTAYKKTTEWLQNVENGRKYLESIKNNSQSDKAKEWATKQLEKLDNGAEYNYKEMIGNKREDLYPGTYWRSVAEASAQDKELSYIQNPDGTWDIIESTPDPTWKGAGEYTTYDTADTPTRTKHKFYTVPSDNTPVENTKTPEDIKDTPELLPTWMRGAGALLPFAFLGQKSDYSNADMIKAPKVGFSPIADYLKYRPLDKQYSINTMNASQQNLRNNLVNMSGGNRAAATNNLMLTDLQAQNTLGDLYKKAEEYNADQRAKVAAQNASVNEFNSQGFYNADQWNASAELQARQAQAQMRHNIDVMTAQANGANLTQGIQNIIGIGDENARLNMINSNPAFVAGYDPNFAVTYKNLFGDYAKNNPTTENKRCGGYLTIKKRK